MTQENAQIEKLDGKSMDVVEHNIEQLKELFPEVFAEGKISFDKLQELLGNYVVEDEDHYNFTWHGKRAAGRLAQTPSTGTLRPARQESVDWDTTQNLFIEGDNLEVLKLLQKSYHRQVKMIYIDPPYNTGKEFIYPDKFQDNLDTYLRYTGQVDAEGYKFSANTDTTGRYHTNWLNMMYPRLKLARNLLREDGVIFISIDDNEQVNLKKLCDEIFGEENFASTFVLKSNPRGSQSTGFSACVHEYLLCYVKNKSLHQGFSIPLSADMIEEYKLEDQKGKYRLLGLRLRGGSWRRTQRPKLYYPIYIDPEQGKISLEPSDQHSVEVLPIKPTTGEDGTWRWSREKVAESINDLIAKEVSRGEDTAWDVYQKDYLHNNDVQKGTKAKTIWDAKEINYQNGTTEVKNLFDNKNIFDFPKPVSLVRNLLAMVTKEKDVVLDFFAGSGTVSHAVMKQNAEDNNNCRCISVQLPEPTDEKSEAYKAGYKNIADISKERIRRAAKKIKEENPEYDGDLGFKVFKLDSSNIKRWEADFDTLEQDLLGAVDYIKNERSSEDVLYELLLKYGLDLTVPIETRTIAGKTIYSIGLGALVVCLEKDVSMDVVNGIGALKEELNPEIMRVVFKDEGFRDDVVKTNALQTLKRYGIEDIKSL